MAVHVVIAGIFCAEEKKRKHLIAETTPEKKILLLFTEID
jgi:hypothetical protein